MAVALATQVFCANRLHRFCLLLTFFLLALNQGAMSQASTPARPHPYLLTTPTRLGELRQAIRTNAWQAQNWLRLKTQADKLLLEEVSLPPRAGNWDHFYIDTISGTILQRGEQSGDWQWTHRNPKTGQLFRSNPNIPSQDYDGVVLGTIHDTWALGVVQLGLAYQLSQDTRYATKARQILLAYADLYPKLPKINRSRGRNPKDTSFGKVHVQTLDEATWLINMVQGADLIWPLLTKRDQKLLQQQLFTPSAELIQSYYEPVNIPNITCWENTAIGMVGLLTQNDRFIKSALTDSIRSFTYQVNHNITPDGFWVERAPGYQFYTLQALITLGQAAMNAGYPVDMAPLKKMFDAPLRLVNPELVLPPFNDSRPVHVLQQAYLYEWAYAHFHDPAYALIIKQPVRGKEASRGPFFLDWSLLYGAPTIPAILPHAIQSVNFPDAGYGLLAKGGGRTGTQLYLKYSPYVGIHSHREQLSFVLMKGTELIAADPGVNNYGDPAQAIWYKTTAAHNTFLLDEATQRPSTARCLAFGQTTGVDYLIMDTRSAYDSVRFIRTAALLTENLILFVDQAQVHRPSKHLEIAYHQVGQWLNLPPTEPWPRPRRGFDLFQNLRVARQQPEVSLLGRLPSGRQVCVSLDTSSPTDIITASDPAITNGEVSSVFLQRPGAASITFAWCIALDGQRVALQVEEVATSGAATRKAAVLRLKLRSAQGQQWEVLVNADQQLVRENQAENSQPLRVQKIR